jgi:iron-sulfur cluster repair protein YtfE (RIC family)
MNAIDLLKNDHDYVDMLFKRVEDTPASKHDAIFKQIKNELLTHAHVEEKVFYPECKSKGNRELQDIVLEGLEEHSQIKKFLAEIGRTTSKDKKEAKLKVLIEDTRHHVKEEENEMFPLVEDQFSSEQLDALGERMESEKAKFQKAKRITPRREQPQGALSKVVEKAMAVVSSVIGTSEEDEKKGTGSTSRGKPKSGSRSTSSKGSNARSASNGKTGSAAGGKTRTGSKTKSASTGSSKGKAGSSTKSAFSKSSSTSKTGTAKSRSRAATSR